MRWYSVRSVCRQSLNPSRVVANQGFAEFVQQRLCASSGSVGRVCSFCVYAEERQMLCGRVIHIFCSTGKLALCVVSVDSKKPKKQKNKTKTKPKTFCSNWVKFAFWQSRGLLKTQAWLLRPSANHCVPSSSWNSFSFRDGEVRSLTRSLICKASWLPRTGAVAHWSWHVP